MRQKTKLKIKRADASAPITKNTLLRFGQGEYITDVVIVSGQLVAGSRSPDGDAFGCVSQSSGRYRHRL